MYGTSDAISNHLQMSQVCGFLIVLYRSLEDRIDSCMSRIEMSSDLLAMPTAVNEPILVFVKGMTFGRASNW